MDQRLAYPASVGPPRAFVSLVCAYEVWCGERLENVSDYKQHLWTDNRGTWLLGPFVHSKCFDPRYTSCSRALEEKGGESCGVYVYPQIRGIVVCCNNIAKSAPVRIIDTCRCHTGTYL